MQKKGKRSDDITKYHGFIVKMIFIEKSLYFNGKRMVEYRL